MGRPNTALVGFAFPTQYRCQRSVNMFTMNPLVLSVHCHTLVVLHFSIM